MHDPTTSKSAPNTGLQVLSCIIGLLGLSVVSFVFARRTASEDFFTRQGFKRLTWSRICVICTLVGSWAFLFAATVLISGAGLSHNSATCSLGIYSCIILYVSTKLFIYAFLAEKVWIVWEPRLPGNTIGHGHVSRWSSPMYRICVIGLSPFVVVVALLVVSRISEVRSDGVCVIGLKSYGSLSLLAYDLFVTLCLTVLFVYPLMRKDVLSPRLRRVASRTLRASLVALISSATNITVLTILHGKELGWVCLSSCGADVTINAIAIYWVTGGTSATPPATQQAAAVPTSPDDSKFDRDAIQLRPYATSPTVTYTHIVRQWRASPPDSDEPESSLSGGHGGMPMILPTYAEPQSPKPVATATGVLAKGVYAIHYAQTEALNIPYSPPPRTSSASSLPPRSQAPLVRSSSSNGHDTQWFSRFFHHLPPLGKSKSMNEFHREPPTAEEDKSIDLEDERMWAKTVMPAGNGSFSVSLKSDGRRTRTPIEQRPSVGPIPTTRRKKPPAAAEPRQELQSTTVISDIEFRPYDMVIPDDADEESTDRALDSPAVETPSNAPDTPKRNNSTSTTPKLSRNRSSWTAPRPR